MTAARCTWLVLALAAWPARSDAGQATCSNPGLPIGAAASPDLLPGRLTLNLTASLLPIDESEELVEGTGPVRYDTGMLLLETRLTAEYVLRPNFAIAASLPYRMVDIDVTTTPMSNSNIHVRTERLTGIGDPSLTLHFSASIADIWRFHARAGTSIPLGSTVEDPHALGAIGQEHQHVQFGTGTFVPAIAFEVQRTLGPATLAGFALAHLSVYENDHGYKAGHRISGGLVGSSDFGLRDWTFGLALEAHGETAERWHGEIPMEEGNEGRLDVLLGPSVSYRPSQYVALVADVKLPVYSHVVGNQLDFGIVAGFAVVAAFDTRKPSWRGLDHERVDPDAALVPVPGKVTVFDLWADWCAPCRDLDQRLATLARTYPKLAVRKLEVGDSDSAAWKRYLAPGSFDLPHIKLYDANGTLVFERTAPPAELARAVEEFLAR